MLKKLTLSVAVTGTLLTSGFALASEDKVSGQMAAIQKMLDAHPEMVLDFTAKSGEYCINTWKVGGSHMTHYAVDPTKTQEDVIDFVKVSSLPEDFDVSKLPTMPDKLGAMEPNQWYYLKAGDYEPHHGKQMPVALLIRATNVQ